MEQPGQQQQQQSQMYKRTSSPFCLRQPLPPIKEGSGQLWDSSPVAAKQQEQDMVISKLKQQFESAAQQSSSSGAGNGIINTVKGPLQPQANQSANQQQQQQLQSSSSSQRITDLKQFEKALNSDREEFLFHGQHQLLQQQQQSSNNISNNNNNINNQQNSSSRVKIKVPQNFISSSRQRSAEALRHTYNEGAQTANTRLLGTTYANTGAGTTTMANTGGNQRYNYYSNNQNAIIMGATTNTANSNNNNNAMAGHHHYLGGAGQKALLMAEQLDNLQDLTALLTQGPKKFAGLKKTNNNNGGMAWGGSTGSQKSGNGNFFETLPVHIKEFYQGKKDFLKPLQEYDVTNYCLMEANERVRCYRYEMGSLLERIGCNYHKIVERLLDATIRLFNENRQKFELQIAENLNIIERLEKEKKDMEANNRDLKNRYIVQESLFKITKINSDALQNEVILLHELLRKDVLNMINHLGTLETTQASKLQMQMMQGQKDDPSDHLVQGLASLNGLITSLESEQGQKEGMMTTMNGLLKAMLRGTKREAYTQVDEGELQWAPSRVINNSEIIPGAPAYLDMEHMAVNFTAAQLLQQGGATGSSALTNLEALKAREKELGALQTGGAASSKGKGGQGGGGGSSALSSADNWNLPVTMVVLLENVARSNETGRVIPWVHFRKMIFDIYMDRLQSQWEVAGSLLTTTVSLDEFACLYFLKTHKLRRVAELQLFEFLVSLRYFLKQQSRAAMFAFLANIATFPAAALAQQQQQQQAKEVFVSGGGGQPQQQQTQQQQQPQQQQQQQPGASSTTTTQQPQQQQQSAQQLQQQQLSAANTTADALTYKFDIYLQNFFFFALQALTDDRSHVIETEQATYITRERAEKQTEYILGFTSEQGRTKVLQRLRQLAEKIKEGETILPSGPSQQQPQQQQQNATNTTISTQQQIQANAAAAAASSTLQQQLLNAQGECVDLDRLLDLYVEEYFECKKRLARGFAKSFSKAFEEDHGVFTIDTLRSVVRDTIEAKSPYEQFSFPRDVNLARAYFYALTSTRNKFDIASRDFLLACSRYGLDCPFPYVLLGNRNKLITDNPLLTGSNPSTRNNIAQDLGSKPFLAIGSQDNIPRSPNQSIGGVGGGTSITQFQPFPVQSGSLSHFSKTNQQKEDIRKNILQEQQMQQQQQQQLAAQQQQQQQADSKQQQSGAATLQQQQQQQNDQQNLKSSLKIEASSTLFAQHFSILRELRTYCKNFKDSYQKEEDQMVLWTQFGVILNILEAGCQFLNFPINI